MSSWHPDAIRVPLGDAGPFTGGGPKLVWHTTEGPAGSGDGAIRSYRAGGSNPTFQLDPSNGKLWQFIAINRSAKALKHPPGTGQTNRDHCIQVELVGRASESGQWPPSYYRRIAKLARWIEKNAGIPRRAVAFKRGRRLSWATFHAFSGHLGHMHVPSNDHYDPGTGFRIDLVLANPADRRVTAWRERLARIRADVKRIGHWTPGRKALAKTLEKLIRKYR